MTTEGKCAGCGIPMKQKSNQNWTVYCPKCGKKEIDNMIHKLSKK